MIFSQFTYNLPGTFDEALTLMQQDTNTELMMGDQALISQLKHAEINPSAIVSLANVPEASGITTDDHFLHVGPMVTYRELAANPVVASIKALSDALGSVADPHLTNNSTIGGALYYKGNNSGSVAAALAVLGAEVEILNSFGSSTITVYDWLLSDRFTTVEPGTVLKSVKIPLEAELLSAFQNHRYIKSGMISFSAAICFKQKGADLADLKIVLSGFELWPIVVYEADKLWQDHTLNHDALNAAVATALETQPVIVRGTMPDKEYLNHLYTILIKKAIYKLIAH